MNTPKASIGLFALIMLMTGAVDGISNLPSIALFGQQLVFFFVVASILFLLPTGLVSAELCSHFKDESGIYYWAKTAFGHQFGALAVWLQWINTMVWFPTCLTTLAGTFSYLVDPDLVKHPAYLAVMSLTVFWIMTLLNLKGIKRSAQIASVASTFGMVFPMLLIIVLTMLWLLMGKPHALTLNSSAILPHLNSLESWTSLTAVITSFLGMELASVHVRKVHNAHQIFPKALVYSILIIIFTMGLGSLGVALVVPHQQILLVTGTIQAFDTIFKGFGLGGLEKVLGVMLMFGSIGAMVNWLISPANGLAHAARDGFLPKSLGAESQHGNPKKVLLLQGAVVSLTSLAFFLMPSVNGSYWFLLDLSTEIYVMMYVLMFLSAFKHFSKFPTIKVIPGGKKGAMFACSLGLLGCLVTLAVGFFPPAGVNVGGADHFVGMFALGILVMTSPGFLLMWFKSKADKK